MNNVYHHDIYINPPRQINVTKEQFDKISYIGIASLFCNYPGIIIEVDSMYKVYMKDSRAYSFFLLKVAGQKRFEGVNFYECKSAEMGIIDVPKEHPLAQTLVKYFRHLIAR